MMTSALNVVGSLTPEFHAMPRRPYVTFAKEGLFQFSVLGVTITAHPENYRDSKYVDTSFLDTVDAESPSSWKVTVLINSQPVSFKIDTGAEVSVLSENIFSNSFNGAYLQQTTKRLCGPD